MSFEDLSGKRFDMLTVIEPTGGRRYGYIEYRCRCDCGNEVALGANDLRKRCRHTCGCHRLTNQDLTGQRFGHLVGIAPTPEDRSSFLFRCDCGATKTIRKSAVASGLTVTCGACSYHHNNLSEKHTTHGMSRTGFYEQYRGMIKRCTDPNAINFADYGGRGIAVCDEWKRFEAFRDWAIASGWREGLTLDRIDNDGPYSPTNCRWVTSEAQQRNKRSNLMLEYRGETKTAVEWSEILGIPRKTLYERIRRGWSVEDALTKPVQKHTRGACSRSS